MKQLGKYIIEKLHIDKDVDPSKRNPYDANAFIEGDILVAVYQFNSRHVHFFKIKGFTGKATVKLIELEKERVSGDWQNGSCIPIPDKEKGEIIKARINNKGRLKYNDYSIYIWNGKPEDYYTD